MNALTPLFIRWSSEFAGLSFPTIDCAGGFFLESLRRCAAEGSIPLFDCSTVQTDLLHCYRFPFLC